jgi:NO-binding membrane sensor protein with MHYT domain
MLTVHNFSYGLLTPVLGYVMSCMGAFIALRCTTRAYAYQGGQRARWLILAAISLGTTGIWVMHFIAMLGYTIPGMTIHYNVPVTIGSMLIAVIVVGIGLFIVGFGKPGWRNLLLAGVITGVGVASMHYSGMAAMEMPAHMSYKPGLFAASIAIALVAATAALWAALRLRGLWHTAGAAMIMGVAVSGMHYTGMAAMVMHRIKAAPSYSGPTAQSFLLPLIIGIGVIALIFAGVLAFSPTNEEIREDAELMARINAATARLGGDPYVPVSPAAPTARWQAPVNGTIQNGAAAPPSSAFYRGVDSAPQPQAPAGPAQSNGHREWTGQAGPPPGPSQRSLSEVGPAACGRPQWPRGRQHRQQFQRSQWFQWGRPACPGLAAPHLPCALRADQAAGHGLAAHQEPGRDLPAELGGRPAGQRGRRACPAQAQERDPRYGRHRCPALLLGPGRRGLG